MPESCATAATGRHAQAFKAFGFAAQRADEQIRHFTHVAFHHGEGQQPRTCKWCQEASATA